MRLHTILLLVVLSLALTGCQAVASIFEAGFAVGILAVLVVLALIGFLFSRMRGRR